MANTNIPVTVGALTVGGQETEAGVNFVADSSSNVGGIRDTTTEFARKLKLFPQDQDQTTLLRRAIDKAVRMVDSGKDVTIVYRDAV